MRLRGRSVSAVLSDCGTYRYALWRDHVSLLNKGCVLFVMLNPSTADASKDDQTIRRCRGYVERWGYGRLAVANLYAFRATDPRGLHDAEDPVGPDNDEWIERLADEADRIIVAWGADVGPIRDRPERVAHQLGEVEALGLTVSGQPRHPLFVRANAEPTPWELR